MHQSDHRLRLLSLDLRLVSSEAERHHVLRPEDDAGLGCLQTRHFEAEAETFRGPRSQVDNLGRRRKSSTSKVG